MQEYLKIKIITPEKVLYEEEIDYLEVPGSDGDMGLYPNHIALMSSLRIGFIKTFKKDTELPFSISGGFLQIINDNVTILADTGEHPDEIDKERAEDAKSRAQKLLEEEKKEDIDKERAQLAFERAQNRLALLLYRKEKGAD